MKDWPFQRLQILYHSHYGECIACKQWNDHETVCFVMRRMERAILQNCFLQNVLSPVDSPMFIDEETLKELESQSPTANRKS